MKINTITHPKFLRLKRRLKLPTWGAVGVLESLWHLTASLARDGAIGSRFTNEDIANYLDWQDDPDHLILALVEAGWLDEHPDHRLVVHDWHEHCPNFVRGNLSNQRKDFVSESITKSGTKSPSKCPTKSGTEDALSPPLKSGTTNTNTNTNTKEEDPPSSPLGGDAEPQTAIVPKSTPYNPRTAALPPELDTPEFREAWADWFAYRRERKLPVYKDRTIRERFSELMALGVSRAVAAIRHSISQCYSGIYEAKETTRLAKPPLTSLAQDLDPALAAKWFSDEKPNRLGVNP